MKNSHDKHQTSQAGALPPVDACRALNDAEKHLASQTWIPDVLRPVLMQAEANCRGNAGDVMAVAAIDHGRLLVKVPDSCQRQSLFEFLWISLERSGGHSIQFAFAGVDETLRVVYMDRDYVGYTASAAIDMSKAGVQLGDWKVEQMPRSGGR